MNTSLTLFRFLSVFAVGLAALGHLRAAPESRLDDAAQIESLLQHHLQAVGGEGALAKITTRRSTGWLERNHKKIPYVQSQRAPNLLQTETRFPKPGTLKQGFDGSTGWVLHPLQGGRKLKGRELSAMSAGAWLSPMQHLREMFPVLHWGGARTIEGHSLLALELAVKEGGSFETWFFDAATFLLVRIERTIDGGPQGIVPVALVFEDYREIDGLKIAYRTRTLLPTTETILQFETVEHNVTFPSGFFAAPF